MSHLALQLVDSLLAAYSATDTEISLLRGYFEDHSGTVDGNALASRVLGLVLESIESNPSTTALHRHVVKHLIGLLQDQPTNGTHHGPTHTAANGNHNSAPGNYIDAASQFTEEKVTPPVAQATCSVTEHVEHPGQDSGSSESSDHIASPVTPEDLDEVKPAGMDSVGDSKPPLSAVGFRRKRTRVPSYEKFFLNRPYPHSPSPQPADASGVNQSNNVDPSMTTYNGGHISSKAGPEGQKSALGKGNYSGQEHNEPKDVSTPLVQQKDKSAKPGDSTYIPPHLRYLHTRPRQGKVANSSTPKKNSSTKMIPDSEDQSTSPNKPSDTWSSANDVKQQRTTRRPQRDQENSDSTFHTWGAPAEPYIRDGVDWNA